MNRFLDHIHTLTAFSSICIFLFFISFSLYPTESPNIVIGENVDSDTVVTVIEPMPKAILDSVSVNSEISPKKEPLLLLININTATFDQLVTLPGIGPVLADRIIQYRTANGPFTSRTDLIKVKGLGEKKCTVLAEFVVF